MNPTLATGTTTSPRDGLDWALASFASATAGVNGVVAVSADGFLLGAAGDAGATDAGVEQLAAAISGLVSLTAGTSALFDLDGLGQIIVEMGRGHLFVMAVDDGSALGALTGRDIDLATIGYEMTLLTERVGTILTPDVVDTLKNALAPAGPEPDPHR